MMFDPMLFMMLAMVAGMAVLILTGHLTQKDSGKIKSSFNRQMYSQHPNGAQCEIECFETVNGADFVKFKGLPARVPIDWNLVRFSPHSVAGKAPFIFDFNVAQSEFYFNKQDYAKVFEAEKQSWLKEKMNRMAVAARLHKLKMKDRILGEVKAESEIDERLEQKKMLPFMKGLLKKLKLPFGGEQVEGEERPAGTDRSIPPGN